MIRRTCFRPLLVIFVCLAAAGCGGGDDADPGSGGDDAGRLEHADGTLTLADDQLTLTPEDGAALTFDLGPEVEPAAVRALEASEAKARVTYSERDGDRTAVAIVAAPKIGEGLDAYEGLVKRIDATQIEVDGADGVRTFSISAQDREAFDVEHLSEHAEENEPVRVYYRSTPDGDAAVAYEDA